MHCDHEVHSEYLPSTTIQRDRNTQRNGWERGSFHRNVRVIVFLSLYLAIKFLMGKTYFHHIFFMPDKRRTSEKRNNKRFTPDNEVRRSFQITRGRFSLKVLFQQFMRDARDTEWQVKERGNILFDTYTLCFHELTHIFLVVMINIHPVNLVSLLLLATTLVGKSSNQRPFPNSVVCFMQYLSPLDTRVDCTL